MTQADLIALFHGIVVMPLLIVGPLVILFLKKRVRWLELSVIIVGSLTILSFITTGGCILTSAEQKLRLLAGEPTYTDGFVRHYLGQIGINWPDIGTTIAMAVTLTLGASRLVWLYQKEKRNRIDR